MTVTLMSKEENITLFQQKSDDEFRQCILFKVPVQTNVWDLEVIIRGQEFEMKEVRKVMIKSFTPQTFIQTDKPIYLPGQTVHFRVIRLDSKLRSVNELVSSNRIGQWLNESSNGIILQLSYKLNSEAPVGTYQIEVWNVDNTVQFLQSFEVEKYVLPKFDVKVKVPKEMSVAQEDITAEVCSTYTYKQPVPATASLQICRPLDHYIMIPMRVSPDHPEGEPEFVAPCHKETKQLDKTGCATFNFNMALFTRIEKLVRTELSVVAEVEEEGTGLKYLGSETIQLSYVIGKLSFIDTPTVFKRGSVVEGKVKAVYFNDTPIPDMLLHLFEGERWSVKRLTQNLTTDSDGVASFLFNTSRFQDNFQLTVSALPELKYQGYRTPHYPNSEHTLSLARPKTEDTPTISSLEVKKRETKLVCDVEELINVHFTFVGEAPGPVDIMYLILARGSIARQGLIKVDVLDEPVTKGKVTIKLIVSPDMAPMVQVVAYTSLPSENIIAHKADFDTEKCFANKVSLEFSPSAAVPGEENRLQLRAQPDSLCGISAVDQSVLIKESGKKLTADKIFNLLPVQSTSMYPYEVNDPDTCLRVRPKRSIWPYPGPEHNSAYSVFQGVGLKMFTNLILKSPSCLTYHGRNYYNQVALPVAALLPPPPPIIETVRTFFPETWLWDLVKVGKSGMKEVPVTVPDTITTWETEAFCLSEQGFGLAPPKELVVFQPFFLELSLPYSIIRGENLELKATVFNYQSSCIMVSVSPAISSDYTLTPLADAQQASCLCAHGRRTHSWKMTPTALGPVNVTMIAEAVSSHTSCDNEIVNVPERGRIDVVTRSLIVKAEGIEQTKTYNILLCPKGESLQEQVELSLPEDVIQGSARASVSVLGDILGRALKNLEGLLNMPYGCGEQNMALLAPNIYILEYLTNTQQITAEIKARATNFLTSGYQRQLNYKHSDGAYSTFGTGSGNTWLTAFVLRSFVKAKSFIYIDPTVIADAKSWLESKQQDNGCFQKLGSLFNNRMKGGVTDEVTLSAYVTAALLETNMSASEPQISKSMSCLRQSLGDKSNTYATALMAYVFTLAADMKTRTLLLEHLDKVATQEGGNLYWSQRSEKSMSLSVEISSYVLLATLSATPTAADLGYASRIVRWLTSQQNSYGGFSSTQDTVVALQALALYSTLVFSPEGSSTVDVQFRSGHMTFGVNKDNKLLYQERALKDAKGKYSVEVKGTACASMQLSLHYNIPTPRDESSFRIKVTPDSKCNTNQLRPKLTLRLESKYVGKKNFTNMVMVDIKMLSGFVPEPESLRKLKSALQVDRVEHNDDHVIIYLKPVSTPTCNRNTYHILQDIKVKNLKPAVVKIYDYYQPSDQAETEYNYPCNTAEQRDLQALTRALDWQFGQRTSNDQSREQLAGRHQQEEESLGAYAADVRFYAQCGYSEVPAAARQDLALLAFLQGLTPEQLWQQVWLTSPQNLGGAFDEAERAEFEFSTRPASSHPLLTDRTSGRWTVRKVRKEPVTLTGSARATRRLALARCQQATEDASLLQDLLGAPMEGSPKKKAARSPRWRRPPEHLKDYTDASNRGLGAVLSQEVEGVDRPVLYLSRKLSDREGRYYTVTVPAVLEAGAESRFCVSLLRPNETLHMTVTLMSKEENITLFQQKSDDEFRQCILFKVPVQTNVRDLEVIIRGQEFEMKEVRKVMIKSFTPQTYIQTDKPIYLPGQTVHFRVITLDSKLRSVNELYETITIKDAGTNRIGQWLNESSNGIILQLSYKLNSEAPVGTYRIEVWNVDNTVQFSQSFEVEKYVLPKFDVKVKVPKEMSVAQEDITAEVCSTYTYKQPVPATALLQICRPLDQYILIPMRFSPDHPEGEPEFVAPCHKETKQLDKTGCATFNFNMALFTRIEKLARTELSVSAEVEEEGTGLKYLGSETIQLSYVIGKLSFIDTPTVYKRGSVVEGKVKAVYFNDTPIPDMLLHLFEGESWSVKRLTQNLTTDSDGVASFLFNTSRFQDNFQLTVSALPEIMYQDYRTPHYEDSEHTLSLARPKTEDTPTISSLEVKTSETKLVCDVEELINISFTFVGEAPGPVDIMYLILARGSIARQGLIKVEVLDEPVTKGEVTIKLIVSPDMAPLVQVVAYTSLPSENIIAHKADFDTEKCFANKVSLEFSPSAAVPGEENRLQLRAQPDSLCGISAVDQSVLIKESGKKLTADKIFNLLPVQSTSMYPYEVNDPDTCLRVRPKRSKWQNPGPEDNSAYSVFQGVGLKMFTNLILKSPSCLTYHGRNYYNQVIRYGGYPETVMMKGMMEPQRRVMDGANGGAPPPPPPIIETVRTFFPETWLWDLVKVGKSGMKEVPVTVPDTITTWETEAFCLSEQGFGLAPPKELVVFQPFFLELSLPYSIIRGENLELKATVFNYQSSCIMVKVSPAISSDYTLTPLADAQQASCLCAQGRRTHSWKLTPTALGPVNVTMIAEAVSSHTSCDNEIVNVPERGRIDVVTRSLIVKAEGIEQTKTFNVLLCPKGERLQEQVELSLPEDVIQGSARASVSVLGDILGRALKNLDGLLSMPYGCGEQNMALLAPNIYILEYLTNTQQITAEIKARATNFLTSGYQRQLNYKHSDGAYSTFGTGSGNTWLTAFVLRSFVKAKSFIYIDPTVIADAESWLESKQQDNGCFQKLGSLFHNTMKGGVSDEVTLSAYVTAALLETNMSASEPLINKSMSCLRQSLGDKSNTYATALLAYVFTLAGDMETRTLLLEHLDKVATQEGGNLYWSQRSEKSMSLSVEISSYVLLATLSATPTAADLGYASRIVRWLTSQQNSYGGFSSTQDTVVALQALALYSTLVFSPEGSSTVDVQFPSGQMTFEVNQDNKLLYQERALKDVTGKYSVEVKGTACASMQLSLHYNIPTPRDESSFRIKVTPDSECNTNQLRPKLTLRLESTYVGNENFTNMVMVDIKLLSGFVPEPESLRKLKSALLVDRVEHNDDHVIIYLKPFPSQVPISHSLDILQDIEVENLKPAVVKIYDYYQPSDQAETEYNYPCNTAIEPTEEGMAARSKRALRERGAAPP
ncbi:unnamed protein product [Lota lota]